jgi:SAM-dependent methyltransferase
MSEIPLPGNYASLDFNAPMSAELADELARRLVTRAPATVLDVGCGWAGLLLRLLSLAPDTSGLGIDANESLVARAIANAKDRHLDGRVAFRAELPTAEADSADVVICVGADHIYGSQAAALSALHDLVEPGGMLLFGTGYWEAPPTIAQAASIGAEPGDHRSLADLVDLALAVGFRLLDLRTATRREWEEFELSYLADWENWLMDWSQEAEATTVRSKADTHRIEYLRGWRDVLGFAYLILGRPATRPAS